MTPSQNKHDPYTNMVSYESTPSGDHNMSICRQAQKIYSGHFFAKSGPSQNFYPRDYLFSRSFRREKKNGGNNYKKVRKPLPFLKCLRRDHIKKFGSSLERSSKGSKHMKRILLFARYNKH